MFIYWKIQCDLYYLGELIQFLEPAAKRELKRWVRKNIEGLTIAENL